MNAAALKRKLSSGVLDSQLALLYGGKTGNAVARCRELIDRFLELYGDREDLHIFTAPGRTEIGGNHTDHNHGRAIAAAVHMDTLAVAAQSPLPIIRVQSAGHPETMIMLGDLSPQDAERNTANALIRGVCAYFSLANRPVGGFDAVTTSNVPVGAGLSSSAAFSVLMGVTLDHLYGTGAMEPMELALAGRYAENRHFGKPSGMLDQSVSAFGGLLHFDFGLGRDGLPQVSRLECDFSSFRHKLCISGPFGSHADLTREYAAVAMEMKMVAAHFNQEVLGGVEEAAFYEALPQLRAELSGRALLRAMHFFAENRRVTEQAEALQAGEFQKFLQLVRRSGRSSFMYLQNVYQGEEESLALALAVSEQLLAGRGAVRVHGGGFAGTMQAFVPEEDLDTYVQGMERVFGAGICQTVELRSAGAAIII